MARVYLEGGGDSKELHSRCREGFRKLLERTGFGGRMPRLVACGGRGAAFDDFRTAIRTARDEFVALLVDSEEPVLDGEQPWAHLHSRDAWARPEGVSEDQALLMITSMETWIASDPAAIRGRFGTHVRLNALPDVQGIEGRSRAFVLAALKSATQPCPAVYSKGAMSFQVLAPLSPNALMALPSFARLRRILDARL